MLVRLLPLLLAFSLPTCSHRSGKPQFLAGGCPPVTETTRADASSFLYIAMRQQVVGNFVDIGITDLSKIMKLTGLEVAPSRTRPCAVYAHWTAEYHFGSMVRAVPGSADLPMTNDGHLDPNAMTTFNIWTKMVSTYIDLDADRLRAEAHAQKGN